MLLDAVNEAARADLAIVVIGTNDNWESEGWDQDTLDLPGPAERTGPPRRRGLPGHRGRRQRRFAHRDAVARRRARCPHGLVPRSGDGPRAGRRAHRRCRAAGPPARHVPAPPRGHAGVRASPGPQRRGELPRGPAGGSPLVRDRRSRAVVPVRIRPRVRPGRHRRCRRHVGTRAVGHGVERRRPRGGGGRAGVCPPLDRSLADRDEPDQRLVGFAKVLAPAGSSQQVHIALHADAYRRWSLDLGPGPCRRPPTNSRRPVVARHRRPASRCRCDRRPHRSSESSARVDARVRHWVPLLRPLLDALYGIGHRHRSVARTDGEPRARCRSRASTVAEGDRHRA